MNGDTPIAIFVILVGLALAIKILASVAMDIMLIQKFLNW